MKRTEEDDRVLKEEYDSEKGTTKRIADKLGITTKAVRARASRLGLCRQYFRWNDKDDTKLIELVGRYPVYKICEKMNKSPNVILARMGRLGLTTRYRDGWYTLQDVVELLRVSQKVIRRCIQDGKLVATYHHGKKPKFGGTNYYHIEEKDLRAFIIEYRYELNGRRIDLPIVIDILVNHRNPQTLHKQL